MSLHGLQIADVYELSPCQPVSRWRIFSAIPPRPGGKSNRLVYEVPHLDLATFQACWQWAAEQHPVLRTSFHWEGLSKPVQVVHRAVQLPVVLGPWQDLPATERTRREGLILTAPPLMNLILLRSADGGDEGPYHLVWTYHPLILDDRSASLLLTEVLIRYVQLRRPERPQLPAPRPFRDFIAWLHQTVPATVEKFWRQRWTASPSPRRCPVWGDLPKGPLKINATGCRSFASGRKPLLPCGRSPTVT